MYHDIPTDGLPLLFLKISGGCNFSAEQAHAPGHPICIAVPRFSNLSAAARFPSRRAKS
ncbi:MAG: hypothetical protein [Olavius algarvensis Delta 4 endosymbiont]|nr:MAG: hypothetical protein [Olavius algarvensis Delta 4 endosymbiont]